MLPTESDDFPPWGKRLRVIPKQTWSGKVTYNRKKHWFKIRDATRIMDKLVPPEDGITEKDQLFGETWQDYVMRLLREATIKMMEKLLPFFDANVVRKTYDWFYQLFAFLLRINVEPDYLKIETAQLIQALAATVGLDVTIKIP